MAISNMWGEAGWGAGEWGEGESSSYNLFNRQQGSEQGRIQPLNFIPGAGDFAYCFGSDLPDHIFLANPGDYLEISQDGDFDDTVLLRLNTRMRPPAQMPNICEVQTPVATGDYTITINGTDFTYSATVGPDNLEVITQQLVLLVNAGSEPVTARHNVDGLISVNADDPEVEYTIAVSANILLDQPEWRFSLRIDGAERAFHVLEPSRTRDRVDLGANTSLLVGTHTLAFRLELISTLGGPIPVELPGAYLDPVTFVT